MFVTTDQTLGVFRQKPSTPLVTEIPYWTGMGPSSPILLKGSEPWYTARTHSGLSRGLWWAKRTGSSMDASQEVFEHVFP